LVVAPSRCRYADTTFGDYETLSLCRAWVFDADSSLDEMQEKSYRTSLRMCNACDT